MAGAGRRWTEIGNGLAEMCNAPALARPKSGTGHSGERLAVCSAEPESALSLPFSRPLSVSSGLRAQFPVLGLLDPTTRAAKLLQALVSLESEVSQDRRSTQASETTQFSP